MFRNLMLATAALVTAVAAYTPAHAGAQQRIVSSNYNHNVGLTLVGKVRPGGSVMLNPQPLPPGGRMSRVISRPGGWVMLNPQPLPPRVITK
jgi:hypothetical protein